MRYRTLLTSSMCLMFGMMLTENAVGGIAWKGFSQLCFEATFEVPVTDGGQGTVDVPTTEDKLALNITLQGVEVQVRCFNIKSGVSCHPGEGNAGQGNVGDINVTETVSTVSAEGKVVITANGCIPLDRWDHHDDLEHQHLCHPFNNKNKIEREGSAHIAKIDTEWELTRTNYYKSVTTVIRKGFQTCFWDGSFDESTCAPQHDTDFMCPIDVELEK